MAEYTAKCVMDEDDQINARRANQRVALEPTGHDVYLNPDAARTFARGILALADEIDGGQVRQPAAVKVGDRFKVTRSFLEWADVVIGDVVTVVEFEDDNSGNFRAVADGSTNRWLFGPDNIGNGLEPLDKPAKREIKVGDRVRIVRNGYAEEGAENVGRVGILEEYDPNDTRCMYRVSLPDRDCGWWCAEVELVDEPADEPAVASRLTYFHQAETALTDFEHTAADIIRLARFLAGE
ncbi:hypothetical protein [Streptomyces eurythermus]